MEFFQQVPSNFFGILASPNKDIYLRALLTLYQAFQTDWSIQKSELVIHLINQLDDLVLQYNLEEAEAEEMPDRTSSAYAQLVLRKLKDTGWIELEMGTEDFQEYISIPDYAYKIIEVLYEIVSGAADTEYNRYVYSTYSVLKTSSESGRDYPAAIDSAFEQTQALFKKLKTLYQNIGRYHRQLADHHQMSQILSEHFDEFKENLADKIYYPIKTFDSVHRFKTPIVGILKEWLYSDAIMQELAQEEWLRSNKQHSLTESRFKAEVMEQAKQKLVQIIDIYESMDSLLGGIDKKNTEYTKATFDRIDFLLNTDRSVKGKVRELIKVLAWDDTEQWNQRITAALDLSPQLIVDEASLYSARQARQRKGAQREKIKDIIDKDKLRKEADDFKEIVQEAFSRKKIHRYMMDLLGQEDSLEAAMIPIEEDNQYVKTILGVLGSDDKSSQYGIEFRQAEIEKGKYKIPDFKLNRKGNQ